MTGNDKDMTRKN